MSERELVFPSEVGGLGAPQSFLALCASFGLAFEEGEVERLGRFLALLLAANGVVNLTAITEPKTAWERHIFDSLTLLPLLSELPDGASVADVGSGGGLPAIPLAIVMPSLRFTMIESTGKKAAFLEHALRELGLENARVVRERAEVVGQDHRSHREMYDAVTARAVGKLATIAELTAPLAKIGGQVLLVKGERADEELAEAKQALHLLHAVHAGTVETPTGRVVVLDKPRKTPRTYPRKAGEPKRAPLGVKSA